MAKKKRKRRIPKAYIYVEKSSRTIGIRDPETGKMIGRKKTRSPGDKTRPIRVKKGPYSGQIIGRVPAIYPVRGSKKQRAHLRRTL